MCYVSVSLNAVLYTSNYLSDITHVKIEVSERPLDLSYPAVEPELLQSVVSKLCDIIENAQSPALLIDNEASVFGVTSLLNDLSQNAQFHLQV